MSMLGGFSRDAANTEFRSQHERIASGDCKKPYRGKRDLTAEYRAQAAGIRVRLVRIGCEAVELVLPVYARMREALPDFISKVETQER